MLRNTNILKLGYRYFKKENVLIYKPEQLIGLIFVAVDKYELYMFEAVELHRGDKFPYTLRIIKKFDKLQRVWKVPHNSIETTIDVSPTWFVKHAVFIQCDENGK